MAKKLTLGFAFMLIALLGTIMPAIAQQKDKIEGIWYNQEKTAKIEIYKAVNGRFCGKIVWLKEPVRNGQVRTDENNPDAAKRKNQLMGLAILWGFDKDGDNGYENGKIYDPKNGKTYSCKITHKGNSLDVRGYVGISLIGRTAVWERTTL